MTDARPPTDTKQPSSFSKRKPVQLRIRLPDLPRPNIVAVQSPLPPPYYSPIQTPAPAYVARTPRNERMVNGRADIDEESYRLNLSPDIVAFGPSTSLSQAFWDAVTLQRNDW